MKSTSLDKAAQAAGIALTYFDANGEPEAISDDTKRALLGIMENPQKAGKSPLPPVVVFSGNRKRELTPQMDGSFRWQLQTEKGKTLSGTLEGGAPFKLPSPLGQGYHQLTLSKGKREWQTRVIVTPRRCYLPPALRAGEKRWGALVQLYTVRSEKNWGIGDFGDLEMLLEQLAARGGDFVGLLSVQPRFCQPLQPFIAPLAEYYLHRCGTGCRFPTKQRGSEVVEKCQNPKGVKASP